jgi:large subunit ribosomal protein L20
MPRAKGGPKTRRRRKKILKKAKGYFGGRRKLYKTAAETSARGRLRLQRPQAKKRLARSLDRADQRRCRQVGPRTQFMAALKKAGVTLDRKVLAELAVPIRRRSRSSPRP